MRILFLSHYYPPEGNAPATRVEALARRWVEKGHDVTVITCAPNVPHGVVYDGYANPIIPQKSIIDGVGVIRVWTWMAPNKGMVRRIINYVSYMFSATLKGSFCVRPDVLIATSPQFFCGWAGVFLKWVYRLRNPFRKPVPFVLEIRDIWPESIGAVEAMNNRKVLRGLEWMEQRMYQAATRIVTVGTGYRLRLIERGVDAEKMDIVMNGVDRDWLEGSRQNVESLRQELDLNEKFVCAYIGTIGMACGLDLLIRAGRKLKTLGMDDVVLLAVGDGATRVQLTEEAAKHGLKNVRFVGRRPKEEIPGFLALADVALVHLRKTPLFESVMPSKIFESAGMRRPILNGVNGDARDLIEAADCGLIFEPEDEDGFIEQLLKLRNDDELATRLGENGYRYVIERFDRDKLARDYETLLERVVD